MTPSQQSTRTVLIAAAFWTAGWPGAPSHAQEKDPSVIAQLKTEAKALVPLLESPLARAFVDSVDELPRVEPRTLHFDASTRTYYIPNELGGLPPDVRSRLVEKEADEQRYYYTKYGTPLAYARVIDLVAQHGMTDVEGRRVLDFGYGTVGHLRLPASMGADAVGVDVDSFLRALYSQPGDTGRVSGKRGTKGNVRLVTGQWPASKEVREEVGGGLDLFISKNTLKYGYIHPEREVDPRMLVHLGVDDRTFAQALFEALHPGGLAIIYNLSPAPAPPDKPYIPWADGRCPFQRELLEKTGFDVVAFDLEDSAAARAMGHALGWDEGEGGMKLETDLFAHYTILRKPR